MNATADRTGFPRRNSINVDGAEVNVGDIVSILKLEEPQPHSNVVDISRISKLE
jgi:hypothetical protein